MTERSASGRSYLDPAGLLQRSGLSAGMRVGDFGVGGAAYFGVQASKMVGDRGTIFAVDVFKPALSSALSKARLEGCTNFKPVWSDLEVVGGTRAIPNNSLDFGVLVNVLHQSKQQKNVLQECARMLKPGARLLIVDWSKGGEIFGPKREAVVPVERVLDLCTQAGLAPFDQFEAGPYHYGLVVVKAG
ncbi:MAG: methyltransferase domain-containing protein [Candidatus Kerfeldbacteria bacterium]|nr:methyltransferase domain-containing protein [Candidatus Kerfeldbacteria bacterium]